MVLVKAGLVVVLKRRLRLEGKGWRFEVGVLEARREVEVKGEKLMNSDWPLTPGLKPQTAHILPLSLSTLPA